MQPDINDLRQQAKAILDRAEQDNRDLTRAEIAEFDSLMRRIDELDAQRERERGATAGAGPDPGPGERGYRRPGRDGDGEPPLVLRTDDGRRVRAATAGESFVDCVGSKRVSEIGDEPNLLGRLVIEWATGRSFLTDRERADMSSGNDPSGGYLLTEDLSSELIDLVRNEMVLARAGATFVPLNAAETRFVTVEQDPQLAYRGEHETVASTDVQLGSLLMRPKSLAAMVTLSDELASDAPNAPEVVERTLARAAAVELDRRLFHGEEASGWISGVLGTEGVNSVDLAGAAPSDYDPWLDAVQLCDNNNIAAQVRLDSPRTKRQLAGLKDSDTRQLPPPREVAELTHLISNQVPTDLGSGEDESVSVVGDFRRQGAMVLVGTRQEFRLEGTRVGAGSFEKLQVKIRISGRHDMAIARPGGLTKVENIGA